MIDKIDHYAITSPASIYDEEALTAIELAARTAAKCNETVEGFNELEESVPGLIAADVKKHIEEGTFDDQIGEHLDGLNDRVDHLLGSVPVGGTSMDAEIIDARKSFVSGYAFDNLGNAMRSHEKMISLGNSSVYVGANARTSWVKDEGSGALDVTIEKPITFKCIGLGTFEKWGNFSFDTNLTYECSGTDGYFKTSIPCYNALIIRCVEKDGNTSARICCVALHSVYAGDVVLIANSWCRPIGGELVKVDLFDRIPVIDDLTYKDRATVYVSANGSVEFEEYNPGTSGGLKVKIGNRLTVKDENGAIGYDWNLIDSELATQGAISIDPSDSLKATITLRESHKLLVFNRTTKRLAIRNGHTSLWSDDIVLVHNTWSVPVAGLLVDAYVRQTAERADETASLALDTAKKALAGSDISMWKMPTAQLMSVASQRLGSGYVKLNVLYFTDPHLAEGSEWENEFELYISHIEQVYRRSCADLVVCGGDWLGNSDSREDAAYKLSYICGRMRAAFGDNFVLVPGNHDTNYQGDGTVRPGSFWNHNAEHKDAIFVHDQRHYAFVQNGIFIVVLDTGTDWNDAEPNPDAGELSIHARMMPTYLTELLSKNVDGYPVMVFAHMASNDPSGEPTTAFSGVLDVLADYNGDCAGIFAGHLHTDGILRDSSEVIVHIPNLKKEEPYLAFITVMELESPYTYITTPDGNTIAY